MKRVIKANYMNVPGGYRYILKHGLGPGTIPRDVNILKWNDLDNWKTEVWLDRALSKEELEKYDIPSETTLNASTDIDEFEGHVGTILYDVWSERHQYTAEGDYLRLIDVKDIVKDTLGSLIDAGEFENQEEDVPDNWENITDEYVDDHYYDYDWQDYM